MTATEIRQLRRSMRLYQYQFADMLKVTRHTVGNWERGKSRPTVGLRKRLAELQAGASQALDIQAALALLTEKRYSVTITPIHNSSYYVMAGLDGRRYTESSHNIESALIALAASVRGEQ